MSTVDPKHKNSAQFEKEFWLAHKNEFGNRVPLGAVGCRYQFVSSHGSHSFLLIGTITGIYFSDETGMTLEVSNRQIHGREILFIIKDGNGWQIVTRSTEDDLRRTSSPEDAVALGRFSGNLFVP